MAIDLQRNARHAKRFGVTAVVVAMIGFVLQTVSCVTRKAPACECTGDHQRITSACHTAAVQLTATLHAIDTDPVVGFQLAAHDASWSQLCGGDGDALGVVAFRRDVAATRAALVELRTLWLAAR